MDATSVPIALIAILGFICLCRLGARTSDWLEDKAAWLPAIVSTGFIFGAIALVMIFGKLNSLTMTVGWVCVAFGGGICARYRNKLMSRSL